MLSRAGRCAAFLRAQIDKAEEYLAKVSGKPFFLWVHLVEPHYAYERAPDAPNFGGDDPALYDSEIWAVDQQVERLVGYLREHGLFDHTLLYLSGDHGEEFGEHGQKWHGTNLYQPQIHPAAMLYAPGLKPRRVKQATTFTDVVPTVMNLLRVKEGFGTLRNRNLTPLLFDEQPAEGHILLENFQFTETSPRTTCSAWCAGRASSSTSKRVRLSSSTISRAIRGKRPDSPSPEIHALGL